MTAPSIELPSSAGIVLTSLSVILPCFNEQDNLEIAVAEASRAARSAAADYEIVIVDDGSSDATPAIAARLADGDPNVRVVTHPVNRGYGAAVRSGITATRSDWVLLTDGDRQFDLDELTRLVPLTSTHELVAGYRIGRADPIARRLAAHAWNRLMHATFGISLRDVDCAFKLMGGPAVRSLELESDGAMISAELLACAGRAGWRVTEVGVRHRPRMAGEPSGGDVRVIVRAFRERRALLRRLRSERVTAPRPHPRTT